MVRSKQNCTTHLLQHHPVDTALHLIVLVEAALDSSALNMLTMLWAVRLCVFNMRPLDLAVQVVFFKPSCGDELLPVLFYNQAVEPPRHLSLIRAGQGSSSIKCTTTHLTKLQLRFKLSQFTAIQLKLA